MFLALHDLRRSWRRFTLIGSIVVLVAMLSTVLSGLSDGLVQDGTSGIDALPFTHMAFQPGADAVFSRSRLEPATLADWEAIADIEASPLGSHS